MWLIIIVFLQLPAKEGFPVIRVICHESVIHVTGHVSHRSEAQGLLPRITRQSETFFPPFPPVSFILPEGMAGVPSLLLG